MSVANPYYAHGVQILQIESHKVSESPPGETRNRLGYEVKKLFTMSLYFMSLSIKFKLDLPLRVRKRG